MNHCYHKPDSNYLFANGGSRTNMQNTRLKNESLSWSQKFKIIEGVFNLVWKL